MIGRVVEPICESCGKPLEKGISGSGEEYFVCLNTKCQAQRLSRIESRLETIEQLLEIKPLITEEIVSVTPEVPITPEAELEPPIDIIRTLPDLSLEEGNFRFYALLNQLGESKTRKQARQTRDKVESLLEQTANEEFSSPQLLRHWAVLMAYSGKTFLAAQRILKVGGPQQIPLLETVIDRANSVLPRGQKELVPERFYSHLLNWAEREGLSETTCGILKVNAGILPPPVEPERIPVVAAINVPVPITREAPPSLPISPPAKPIIRPPTKSWIDRFRPEEGWEFTIGANWLRWVGVGIILFAIFLLVVWSASQLELTTADIALLAFVGLVLSGVILHGFSFILLRFKERSQYLHPIAYSLAFLALGIYYIAMFALRFHPFSPFVANEVLFITLCLVLVLVSGITAWRHNTSILFIEGYGFVLWLFWHLSSQIFVNNVESQLTIFIWLSYIVFINAFLAIGYLRKDMVLTISVQLLSLSLLFLPNSSEVFSYPIIEDLPDLNAMIVLLSFVSILYWIIGFRFPLDSPTQFYEIINRNHLSIASATPVFASFFLLSFENISGSVFIPFVIVFTIAFLSLAYLHQDLGLAFLIILLTQLLWLISVGIRHLISTTTTFLDDIYLQNIPEINGVLTILLFLTFAFWVIARRFPSDEVPSRFWDSINRQHLSIAAVGPIFISFILSWFGFITTTIYVMYLVLFCILWSTNRIITYNIPDFPLQNITLFDFVTYSAAALFLVIIAFNPNDILFGGIIGFIAFPSLILINQNISRMSIQDQEIRELYTIVNCLFISAIFLILSWKDKFSQVGEIIFATISEIIPGFDFDFLQFGYNWAFLGYLWIIIVSVTTLRIFQSHITRLISTFILVMFSPSTMFVYLAFNDVSDLIHLLFVLVGYIHLIALLIVFTRRVEVTIKPTFYEHLVFIPGIALLQIIGNSLIMRTIQDWNIILTILVNFIFPFSIGFLMVVRRSIQHLVDSYLIVSTSIFTFLQFIYLDSNQQGNAWLLQLTFLAFGLIYLYTRIYFGKEQLQSASTSHSILKIILPTQTFSNKEQMGVNLLILCVLGLISNTLCFVFFPTAWSPTVVFLIFDSMAIIPMVFAITLLKINSRVAIVNTLTLYSSGIILRLPMMSAYGSIITYLSLPILTDYNIYLFIGLIFQVILHCFLIVFIKSGIFSISSTAYWRFELKGRKTWPQDSLRLMLVINPIIFYLYTSELVLRFSEILVITEILRLIMVIFSILIAIYFVGTTRFSMPTIVSDSGLLFSVLVAWLFTITSFDLFLIYFTTAATAFICILYGFWINKREWRILGILSIASSLAYSAIQIANLGEDIQRILGFLLLGIISVVIGFVYSKFASRFVTKEDNEKISDISKT